jgi:MFS family permease
VFGAIGFAWTGFVESWQILLVALLPVAIGLGVATPTTNSLITRESSPADRGQVLGISQSIAALARVVGPLFAGFALEYEVWLPFVLAALLVSVAAVFALRLVPSTHPSEDPRFQTQELREKTVGS